MALLEDTYVVQSSLFKKKRETTRKAAFGKAIKVKKGGAERGRERVRE